MTVPLAAAAARLQVALDERWSTGPSAETAGLSPNGATVEPPAVVALGAADLTGDPDPVRRDANVHLTGGAVFVGPWGDGGDGGDGDACGHCFGVRWQRLRGRTERDALETGDGLTAAGDWPDLPEYVVDAVWAVFRAAAGAPPTAGLFLDPHSRALRRVTAMDLASLRTRTVPVLREPLCPTCSTVGPPAPWEGLTSRRKPAPDRYRLHGVHDYRLPVGALVNPASGVIGAGALMNPAVPTTAPVTGGVFVRGYAGLLDVAWSGHATGYADSLRLAYLEGLERYAGTHHRRAGRPLVAAYADVTDRALDPTACGVYPDATYDADPLVERFDPDRPIPWVRGHRIRTGEPVLVPRRLCFYSTGAPGDNFVLSSSNGCATGGCLEEAILYGLLELVERDAFLLAWYARRKLRRIDLDSCASTAIRAMVDRSTLAGYDVLAFDNRTDLTVPVVTTLAVRHDGGPGLLAFAAGAHPDPERAVAAALSETLSYIPLKPRTTRRRWARLDAMADDYTLVQTVHDHADLFGLPRMRGHAAEYLSDRPAEPMTDLYATQPPTHDLLHDLNALLDELYGKGFDVIVVDQTTPEQFAMGLRTVCTIVPGLLPIDFGWLRQRALTMPRLLDRVGPEGPRPVPHPFP